MVLDRNAGTLTLHKITGGSWGRAAEWRRRNAEGGPGRLRVIWGSRAGNIQVARPARQVELDVGRAVLAGTRGIPGRRAEPGLRWCSPSFMSEQTAFLTDRTLSRAVSL